MFDRINDRDMRFAVGAVHVMSGNSVYFDNFVPDTTIAVEHVMASGALPPGFPPVKIGKDYYWDGGLVSNSPLWYVLDDTTLREALILQVDLFSASGDMPTNLDEVLERQKDIQYSSKTRFNTNRAKEIEALEPGAGPGTRAAAGVVRERSRRQAARRGGPRPQDRGGAAHQSPLHAFIAVEGLRILASDRAHAVGKRARRRAADDGEPAMAEGMLDAPRLADVRSRALISRQVARARDRSGISTSKRSTHDEAEGQGCDRHRCGKRPRQGHRVALCAGRRQRRDRRPQQ